MTLLQGTVVCRSDRVALAVVEDVFGPVSAPRYLLRFASQKAMEELDVRPGLPVFYPKVLPPRCSCCASFCFLRDRGLQGQAYLVKREELYQKVAAVAARACISHFSRVFYCQLSRLPVLVQGSDASNAHDEEVGEHEQVCARIASPPLPLGF